ncbi:hypothetical protein chiPu_0006673 [Chiloscyllium punctatum]|uniref:Mitochondrial fission regulator n=1 Tax=Chiloscyllium punctatum TaxID=137246 RepID=A0A401SD20_CHIPU|nr:hypothetical protein [Chiloscyllium punctatum]
MIRMMLEYAGIDMDSPFWSNKPYGSSRSIIRRIGSSLPLKPCPRVHFQIFHGFGEADRSFSESEYGAVASLADIGWIVCDQGESFSKLRSEIPLEGGEDSEHEGSSCARPISRQTSLPNLRNCKKESATPTMASDAALEKIHVLENELAKLREQIAMIVTIQEQRSPAADQGSADPTALIAAALKRKFAHHYKNDHCSENRPSDSDFQASTEPPKFGQHLLKPTGKRKPLLETSSHS